jgi:hypothetical protein
MMMQSISDKPIHTELEVTSGNTILAHIGRDYKKVNEGLAICALIMRQATDGKNYHMPFMVSENKDAVIMYANYATLESVLSVDYEGKTYYLSKWQYPYASYVAISSNPFNLPYLSDITGIEYTGTDEGQIQSAIDLLDYYFGKRWQ